MTRYWRVLRSSAAVLEELRGEFNGKQSPVHPFWHPFDLALSRFSGRRAPVRDDAGAVEADAYSHEVIAFGFWAGDDTGKGLGGQLVTAMLSVLREEGRLLQPLCPYVSAYLHSHPEQADVVDPTTPS